MARGQGWGQDQGSGRDQGRVTGRGADVESQNEVRNDSCPSGSGVKSWWQTQDIMAPLGSSRQASTTHIILHLCTMNRKIPKTIERDSFVIISLSYLQK